TNEAGWCSQLKHYVPEVLIVPGSHDVSQGGGEGISDYVENCPYPLTSPAVPGVGTPGYGYEYYFDYPAETPLARFIMISPGLGGGLSYNYSEESPHTEWLEDAVDNARDQGIPWVVGGEDLTNITVDGSNPQIGYFAQAMGRNANTKGELPGFGSVFYTVTADSVTAKTDFCPTGSVGPDGHCTADRFRVFADRFSISDS